LNKQPRPRRTDSELVRASGHLYYEIEMLFLSTVELARNEPIRLTVGNALIESFTLHARALLDFLYESESPKRDDMIASDFFDDPSQWFATRPPMTPLLDTVRKRVGKETAHLTYHRQQLSPEQKEWRFMAIAQDIKGVIEVFVSQVPPGRIVGEIESILRPNPFGGDL